LALIKTEAIVLKSYDFRETSKIVTFFSRTHGKISGIAKGVRSARSRWGGALQPASYVSILLYYKKNGNLHLISSAEYVHVYKNIISSFDRLKATFAILKILDKILPEENRNCEIFELTLRTLSYLDTATNNFLNVLFYFEIKLAELLGISVNIEKELRDNIDYINGETYFYGCRINPGDVKVLHTLCTGNFKLTQNLIISETQVNVINNFFREYFSRHLGLTYEI